MRGESTPGARASSSSIGSAFWALPEAVCPVCGSGPSPRANGEHAAPCSTDKGAGSERAEPWTSPELAPVDKASGSEREKVSASAAELSHKGKELAEPPPQWFCIREIARELGQSLDRGGCSDKDNWFAAEHAFTGRPHGEVCALFRRDGGHKFGPRGVCPTLWRFPWDVPGERG